jgi:hypothetical protein
VLNIRLHLPTKVPNTNENQKTKEKGRKQERRTPRKSRDPGSVPVKRIGRSYRKRSIRTIEPSDSRTPIETTNPRDVRRNKFRNDDPTRKSRRNSCPRPNEYGPAATPPTTTISPSHSNFHFIFISILISYCTCFLFIFRGLWNYATGYDWGD